MRMQHIHDRNSVVNMQYNHANTTDYHSMHE